MTDDLRTRAREAAEERYSGPQWHVGTIQDRQVEAYVEGFLAHAAQQPTREQIDVDELARVVDQAADDWDLGIGNGGQTWEHALARAVIAHLKKGTRTMSESYVPTTGQVRIAYSIIDGDASTDQRKLAFDRWLAAHDRQVKAEAWDEGYLRGRHPWTGVDQEDDPIPPCTAPPTWGRNANPYRIETEEAP